MSKPGWTYDPSLNIETSDSQIVYTPVMHIASIDPDYVVVGNGFRVESRVTVQDQYGVPVNHATVSGTVAYPDGRTFPFSATTDVEGVAYASTFTYLHGTFTFTVTDATKTGLTYDPSQNVETSDSVTVP